MAILDIWTANGYVVSTLKAEVLWRNSQSDRKERIFECDIENFVPVVAVTKQQEFAFNVISPAEGNLERDERITEKILKRKGTFK